MNRLDAMAAAARDAMIHVLDLVADDRVLVVTDPETRPCGDAFARGARELGCEAVTFVLSPEGRPLKSIPPDLPPLLQDVTVVVDALTGDAEEVPFRLQWIRMVEGARRIRLGHSPGIVEDMMTAGALGVDYARMRESAGRLGFGLAGAVGVHLTTPAGTDLSLDLTGREWTDDLKATRETGVNLPCGEIYCAPLETGADGVIVVDGCFGAHGVVASPVRITVSGGRATEIVCEDAELVSAVTGLMDTDPGARTIAELGIGLNPGARLTDRMLEAEKVLGTAHIAFGDNESISGGMSRSKTHVDYLMRKPTLVAVWKDGRRKTVLAEGLLAEEES